MPNIQPMTTTLRSTVAVAHAMPTARLVLGLRNGGQLEVSRHPSADISPCQMRHVLVAEHVHGELACIRHIGSWHFDGDIAEAGPAVYRSVSHAVVSFATPLDGSTVERLADQVDFGGLSTDIDLVIKPDSCLGVTVVVAMPTVDADAQAATDLAAVIERVAGACLAEEIAPAPHRSVTN